MAVNLLHITFIASVAFVVWRKQTVLRRFYWPALGVKLLGGVSLGLIYAYYYSVADTFAYFGDAARLASLARASFSSYVEFLISSTYPEALELSLVEPRALFLTKITSIFNLLTYDNYWVIGAYYSLLSFLSAWFLVRTLQRNIPAVGSAALIAFLFLPSVVFWSSGLLKESLALASLYFLTAVFLKMWFGERCTVSQYIVTAVSLWIFWNLKYYYAAVFFPVVFTTILYKYVVGGRFLSSPGLRVILWLAMFTIPVVLVTYLHPNFHHDRLLKVILENNAAYTAMSSPENIVRFRDLDSQPLSFLRNAPRALFAGLFRPLFWEASSFIQVLPALENMILFLLFLAACLRYKSVASTPHQTLLVAATTYVILLSILITFAAPNFGTLSRYKTGYISFFALIILCNNPLVKYMERSFRRLVSQ